MATCAVCSTPVRRARSGPTLCGARECRRAWLGSDIRAAQRAQAREAHDGAATIAGRVNAARRAAGASRALPLAVLPSNDRVTAPLPAEFRARFLAKLDARAVRVFATNAVAPVDAGARTPNEDRGPGDAAMNDLGADPLLGAACATCRGDCCTGGTDHAHLDDDSLRRARATHGWTSADALQAAYAAHLPRVHYRGSCVYHGVQGCTLPRAMRADICNRHLCGALAQLVRAIDSGAEAPFVAVATSWAAPQRAAVISAAGATPIARS